MDQLQPLRSNFQEIKAGWPDATLSEKENYVAELKDLEIEVISIRTVEGTKLLHDVRYLRSHIQEKMIPAQQRRSIDLRRSQQLPGASL